LGNGMKAPKPEKKAAKVVKVPLYGHSWPVYPMKSRGKDIFRVFHRVNGERIPKTFMSLVEAKADAKSILKELYGRSGSKIHLTDDEKRDWQAAMIGLKQAGIRSSLETVVRHYSDLAKIVGHASLLTDVARKYADGLGKTVTPVKLSVLRDAYLAALKKQNLSKRYIDAQRSHTGQFLNKAGDVMSDRVTREELQGFLDSKRGVDARTKLNLLEANRAMLRFGRSKRYVPRDWDEADHVVTPAEQPKQVKTYTAEELKKLLAAAPDNFRPILALAAFAGIRSSELELLDWHHIRSLEKEERDRIINLDVDVTEESSKRSVPICKTLGGFLAPALKNEGKIWTGRHDDFYRIQQVVAKKAGVTWKQNALRHTCISAKVALTRDVGQVAYESGNSVAVIKKYYLNLLRPSAAQAWFDTNRAVVLQYRHEVSQERQQGESAEERESAS
jgi:integrase